MQKKTGKGEESVFLPNIFLSKIKGRERGRKGKTIGVGKKKEPREKETRFLFLGIYFTPLPQHGLERRKTMGRGQGGGEAPFGRIRNEEKKGHMRRKAN